MAISRTQAEVANRMKNALTVVECVLCECETIKGMTRPAGAWHHNPKARVCKDTAACEASQALAQAGRS